MDPNWFASSLAQCSSAIVALLAGIALARIQHQLISTEQLRFQYRRAVLEARRQLRSVWSSVHAFDRWATAVLPEVTMRQSAGDTAVETSEERWLAGSRILRRHSLNIDDDYTLRLRWRIHTAGWIMSHLQRLATITSLSILERAIPSLKAVQQELRIDSQDEKLMDGLIDAADEMITLGSAIESHRDVRVPTLIGTTSLVLWWFGIIAPLADLSSHSVDAKVQMLLVFAFAAAAMPLFLLAEVRRLKYLAFAGLDLREPLVPRPDARDSERVGDLAYWNDGDPPLMVMVSRSQMESMS